MARNPPPPNLSSGLNFFQRLILVFGGGLIVLTGPFPWAVGLWITKSPDPFSLKDPEYWPAFVTVSAIVAGLYILATPAFWRVVLPAFGQAFSEAVESSELASNFWRNIRNWSVFVETIKIAGSLAVLGGVVFFIVFDMITGTPIGKAPNQLADKIFLGATLALLAVALLAHIIAAVRATIIDLATSPRGQSQYSPPPPGEAKTTNGNDSEFAFDPSAFSGGQSGTGSARQKTASGSSQGSRATPARSTTEDAPRGFDQRRPEDAKLWAIVDDPAAADQERKTAFEMILRRTKPAADKGE